MAVCNLASIAVNMFVRPDRSYDFQKLYEVTKVVTKNLNKIIDVNYYPVPEASKFGIFDKFLSKYMQCNGYPFKFGETNF